MMKITVNEEVVLSNFPAEVDPAKVFDDLSDEAKLAFATDPNLFELRLDTYTLPSLMLKVAK